MGKFSKDKGNRVERDFVRRLNAFGISAKRVPLSGAMPNYKDDITVPWLGGTAQGEIKARADGFKEIYKWINPVKVLFIKANRKEGLAVIRLKDFAELLSWANSVNQTSYPPIPNAIVAKTFPGTILLNGEIKGLNEAA